MIARNAYLALFLFLVVAASYLGSGFEAGHWYHVKMNQPSLTPPDWLYAIAWSLVYLLMALAAWQIWLTGHESRVGALTWWALLLVLTVAWPALFFGLHRPGWALPLLALMAGAALFCMRAFNRLSSEAGTMMAPVLLWMVYLLLFDLAVWSTNGSIVTRFL